MVERKKIVAKFFKKFFPSAPIGLIDIGASGGLNPNWGEFSDCLNIIGFEPDKRAFEELITVNNKKVKYYNFAVYSEKATLNFYLNQKQQTSSIYQMDTSFITTFPQSERFDLQKIIQIETNSLDNIIFQDTSLDVDFLKVDSEGCEYPILKGAKDLLNRRLFGVEIEVLFAAIRKDAALFSEIDQYMRQNGFQLFDIRRTYWKRSVGKDYGNDKGQLIFGDALYLKTVESLHEELSFEQNDDKKKEKVVKAISICIIYGYFDYALLLFEAFSTLFTPEENEYIQKHLKQEISLGRKIPDFRGRGRIADLFRWLSQVIDHPSWAASDQSLGNV